MLKEILTFKRLLISTLLLASTSIYSQTLPVSWAPFYDTAFVNFRKARVIEIWMGEVPGKTQYFWVLGQEGTLWSLYPTSTTNAMKYEKKPLFNISARVPLQLSSEYGSYDVAFHPDFIKNKKFYVLTMVYRDLNNKSWSQSDLVLEEWQAKGALSDTVTFTKEIMRIPHASESFGTSSMLFGADGYLYLSVSDYYKNGWDLKDLGRKVLRIDVNKKDAGKEYGIPSDNPYASNPSDTIRKEIWASGFRNGWSMTLAPNGDLWLGDVGQWQNEEINLVKPGLNYGWRDGGDAWDQVKVTWKAQYGLDWADQSRGFEGFCADRLSYGNAAALPGLNCSNFKDPMWRFKNRVAVPFHIDCVIVGPVINGKSTDPLYGKLMFADNTTSKIYVVNPNNPTAADNDPTKGPNTIANLPVPAKASHNGIVSFTEDGYGNIYVVINSWDANIKHEIFKLTGLIPRDTLLSVSTSQNKFSTKQAKQSLLYVSNNSKPFFSNGAQPVSLYSLSGTRIWQSSGKSQNGIQFPENLSAGVYRVVYK